MKEAMAMLDGNVAFKVTWLYATKGDFKGPCNSEGRALNTHRGGNWCSQPECHCYQLDRAKDDRDIDLREENYPCSESAMFDRSPWSFNSGSYHKGRSKDGPIPMRHAKVGRFAFFTSKNLEMVEDQRIIIAAYEIGAVEWTEEWGYEVSGSKGTQIRVRDLKRAPKFWKFYQNSFGPPAWRSGLFRYVPDEQAEKMYRAVKAASLRS
jgi:hypothetical protein